jgi:hypothetical protein
MSVIDGILTRPDFLKHIQVILDFFQRGLLRQLLKQFENGRFFSHTSPPASPSCLDDAAHYTWMTPQLHLNSVAGTVIQEWEDESAVYLMHEARG